MIGTTIGHYRILERLGKGGMGEVWKAEDTQLRRTVALKFLSSDTVGDDEIKARLIREAQASASLDHPNICHVYGIHEDQGETFIAMAFVDGPSLADKIKERPLPLEDALTLAAQIAEGLQEAHDKGIVHRDIKPHNVMLTAKGQVKIMDFGLASLSGRSKLTKSGTTLGTPAYMAPEQLEGRGVDRRADIWALGCVLHEMLTQKTPFDAEYEQAIAYGILNEEPEPLTAMRSGLPKEIDRIAGKALAKDPEQRYQHVADLLVDLRRVRHSGSSDVQTRSRRSRIKIGAWTIAASLLVLVVGFGIWRQTSEPVPSDNPRHLRLWEQGQFTRLTDFEGNELDASISPDGGFVAFIGDREGVFDAWVTQVGSGTFVNLTKGEFPELFNANIRSVGFSPDAASVWLRIRTPNQIASLKAGVWMVPTLGGTARPFLDDARLIAWSPDGQHIAYHDNSPGDPIFLADRDGSSAREIFRDQPGRHCHFQVWSPDGRYIYFVRGAIPADTDIWRISVDRGSPERITHHAANVRYPTFLNQSTLLYTVTQRDGSDSALYMMDLAEREARRLSHGLEQYVSISASRDGRRLVASVSRPTVSLWSAPISSEKVEETMLRGIPLPNARARAPRFGGGYLLYASSQAGEEGVWRFENGEGKEVWRAERGSLVGAAAPSRDGNRICFPVRRGGRNSLFVTRADGTSRQLLAEELDVRGSPSWSPDGRWIAIAAVVNDQESIWKVPVDGGPPVQLVKEPSRGPVWSPNGRLIVYYSKTQGATFPVRAVTPQGETYPVPEAFVRGDRDPFQFLPDGRRLVVLQGPYRHQDFWLLDLSTGRSRQLTELRPGFRVNSFDISPDGSEIVFDRRRENADVVLIDLPSAETQ